MIVGLKVTEYTQDYYDEHKDAGLDYLGHGYWQEEYAKMVVEACKTPANGFVVDAGCACGSILNGFKKLGFNVFGADLNESMINMGKEYFELTDKELVACSIADLPLADNSVDLYHSAQVLEHIPEEMMDDIIDQMWVVLKKGGKAFICLDAIRDGETKDMYMGDPTHVNIQPIEYWVKKFKDFGFDVEAYNNFVNSPFKPTENENKNFYQNYPYWSVWTLVKL